jgi:hypothetical protein
MVIEDVDIESMVTARSAGTEDMEPEEYEAYVKTQIAKALKKTLLVKQSYH